MSKNFYNSLKIVIQQIDKYLIDKKDLGRVVSSLEIIISQISNEILKVKLDQEWAQLEIIYATLLDQDSEPDESTLKKIYEILYNAKNALLQEADSYYVLPESDAITKDQFLKECRTLIEKAKLQGMKRCDFVENLAELITKNKDKYNEKSDVINAWSKLYNSSLDNPGYIFTPLEFNELEKTLN